MCNTANDMTAPSTKDNSPPRMEKLDYDADTIINDVHIGYKQLTVKIARQISPNIQGTFAATDLTMVLTSRGTKCLFLVTSPQK